MQQRLHLQQKLTQKLVMTLQMQQAIQLLQLSMLELSDIVQKELVENPVLEEAAPLEVPVPERTDSRWTYRRIYRLYKPPRF